VFLFSQAAGRVMIERDGGLTVNIASVPRLRGCDERVALAGTDRMKGHPSSAGSTRRSG